MSDTPLPPLKKRGKATTRARKALPEPPAPKPPTTPGRQDARGRPILEAGTRTTRKFAIAMQANEFNYWQRAYDYAYRHPDEYPEVPDTYSQWVSDTLRAWANLPATRRATLTAALPPRGAQATKKSRTYDVEPDIFDLVDNERARDGALEHRVISRSEFARRALTHALLVAQAHHGGPLPEVTLARGTRTDPRRVL